MEKKTIRRLAIAGGIVLLAVPGIIIANQYGPHKEKKDPNKKTIICVGDSITFGAGVIKGRRQKAWPYLLGEMLPEDTEVLDYGISGATMLRKSDKPYSRSFLKAIDAMDAEAIILMLGTNDSKPQNWDAEGYRRDTVAMIERLQKEGRQLYLMLPPKAFKLEGADEIVYQIRDDVIGNEVVPILRDLASRFDLPLIDLYRLTENHPEYFDDGVHPNETGNRAIAQYVRYQLNL